MGQPVRPTPRPFSSGCRRGPSPLNGRGRTVHCEASLFGLPNLLSRKTTSDQQLAGGGPELEPDFQGWLRAQGADTQPLVLRQCGVAGRGLVASRPVRRGEAVVQLPERLLITAERAAQESCLAPLLQQQPLPEWSLLALYIAEIRGRIRAAAGSGDESLSPAVAAAGAGAASPVAQWGPYVSTLPQQPGTVLEWTEEEVRQLLCGSPLLRAAREVQAAAAASLDELSPLLARGRAEGLLPRHVQLDEADLRWAFGVLLSRAIRLPGRGDAQVLAPWADMLNHDVGAACHLDWEAAGQGRGQQARGWGAAAKATGATGVEVEAGALVLRADRDYAPGEQVFVSYGPKGSGELLLSYGFCPPPAANPHTGYTMRVGVDMGGGDPHAEAKLEVLRRRGLPAHQDFPLRLEGWPHGLLQHLALAAARPATAAEAVEAAEKLLNLAEAAAADPRLAAGTWPLVGGEDSLALALRELGAKCAAELKEYPTTMEQDQAVASGAAPPTPLPIPPPATPAVASRGSRGKAPTATRGSRKQGGRAGKLQEGGAAAEAARREGSGESGGRVGVDTERARAMAGVRVRERQVLLRTQAAASGQLAEVRRAARGARR